MAQMPSLLLQLIFGFVVGAYLAGHLEKPCPKRGCDGTTSVDNTEKEEKEKKLPPDDDDEENEETRNLNPS